MRENSCQSARRLFVFVNAPLCGNIWSIGLCCSLLMACSRNANEPPTSGTRGTNQNVTWDGLMHNYRVSTGDRMSLEVWTDGSRFRPIPNIDIYLRVSSPKELLDSAKGTVSVFWSKDKKGTPPKSIYQLEFEERQRERLVILDQGTIKVANPGRGWEKKIRFSAALENYPNEAFEEEFYLSIEVLLDKNAPLSIKNIPITVAFP